MRSLSSTRKHLATAAGLALLVLPLSACGDDADTSGSGGPAPVAVIDKLEGKTTEIKLDKGFVKALGQLGLTPGVVGGAKFAKGTLSFPITGGNVTVFKPGDVSPYVIGQIQHEASGLTLSAGGTTVRLSNFNVDPGISKVYGDVAVNGKTAATSAILFNLDGRTLEPLSSGKGTATLQGTKVQISEVAAPLLNQTFNTDAVKRGLLVGVAKITVSTK